MYTQPPVMDDQFDNDEELNNFPPMDGDNQVGMEDENEYDSNFDAGVDADEDNDPKRYIQQLTGKLSQSLRKYQEELPTPDSDLDKYVAGMILKQTTNGLNDEDTKEILGKINGDKSDTDESISRSVTLNELFQDLNGNDDDQMVIQKATSDNSYRANPYTSPRFE